MPIVLNLPATPAMLEAIAAALEDRRTLLNDGNSADEAARGLPWVVDEVRRLDCWRDAVQAHPQYREAMAARVTEFRRDHDAPAQATAGVVRWKCPACDRVTADTITDEGPFGGLTCDDCGQTWDRTELQPSEVAAWDVAIEALDLSED